MKYHDTIIGRLPPSNLLAFEYDTNWLRNGFYSISPFKLPLENRFFIAKREPFDGVFGVFNDYLPYVWGQLLVNHELQCIYHNRVCVLYIITL